MVLSEGLRARRENERRMCLSLHSDVGEHSSVRSRLRNAADDYYRRGFSPVFVNATYALPRKAYALLRDLSRWHERRVNQYRQLQLQLAARLHARRAKVYARRHTDHRGWRIR